MSSPLVVVDVAEAEGGVEGFGGGVVVVYEESYVGQSHGSGFLAGGFEQTGGNALVAESR